MRNIIIILSVLISTIVRAQLNPAITSWLQNTTKTGKYYPKGNPTLTENDILVNCQKVEYSNDFVFVTATGIPSYPTGPFNDRNPSNAENQNGIYKIPLNPSQNIGELDATVGGNIGLFINGVALFDYRDGVAWNPQTNALCGGPGNPRCPGGPSASMAWNRDAIPAEKEGFDCAKGHPAMGNYHHHQNPSAFKLDLEVISDICNIYDAEGLYAIDSTKHSPLIGFSFDGYPIYGAYGYTNNDGTGGITRIKSGYQLRNITERTHHHDGTDVEDGPAIDATYFLGYFREDYGFNASLKEDVLDEHNGRFCITPEYPKGTYAYFCTVDRDWNSAYPYAVGPYFYGNFERRNVTSVDAGTTIYTPKTNSVSVLNNAKIIVFPNPASDLIAIQLGGLNRNNVQITLSDMNGKKISSTSIPPGSTITYYDVQTVYEGNYLLKFDDGINQLIRKVSILR